MANRSVGSPVPSDDDSPDLDPPGGFRYGSSRGPLRALHAFNVSNNLVLGCAASGCSKTMYLILCSCGSVQYCSAEHRSADRPAHRSICSKVGKAQRRLEKEEKALRREEGDETFEKHRGRFWNIPETRDYMRARFVLVEALLMINTEAAVTSALDHLLDMLQLSRMDSLGLHHVVPALCLRLGRDQKAYDFCIAWLEVQLREERDNFNDHWDHNIPPFLDIRNADVFGGIEYLVENIRSLSHMVAIMLSKIRLIIDLKSLQRAKIEAGPRVPREILDVILEYTINSDITYLPKMIEREDHTSLIYKLKKQVKDLYIAVEKTNRHFWPALVEPGDHLKAQPIRYTYGDEAQMQLVLQYNYNAWAETPGAIAVVDELCRGPANATTLHA